MMRLSTKQILTTMIVMFGFISGCREQDSAVSEDDHPDANHCEIFVDKVVNLRHSHSYKEMHLYIKTLNDRLDGAPVSAGFRYKATDNGFCADDVTNNSLCHDLGEWKEKVASPFFSDHYFKLSLFIGSDYSPHLTYEGVFFVKTAAGTTYWAKRDGQNFILSSSTFSELGGRYMDLGYSSAAYGEYNLDHFPKTSDFFTTINPSECR